MGSILIVAEAVCDRSIQYSILKPNRLVRVRFTSELQVRRLGPHYASGLGTRRGDATGWLGAASAVRPMGWFGDARLLCLRRDRAGRSLRVAWSRDYLVLKGEVHRVSTISATSLFRSVDIRPNLHTLFDRLLQRRAGMNVALAQVALTSTTVVIHSQSCINCVT